MSFFKDEPTELEELQKEINENIRNNSNNTYNFEEEFNEVKVGGLDANRSVNTKQLSIESNEDLSFGGRD